MKLSKMMPPFTKIFRNVILLFEYNLIIIKSYVALCKLLNIFMPKFFLLKTGFKRNHLGFCQRAKKIIYIKCLPQCHIFLIHTIFIHTQLFL